jgi:hypothetical protein
LDLLLENPELVRRPDERGSIDRRRVASIDFELDPLRLASKGPQRGPGYEKGMCVASDQSLKLLFPLPRKITKTPSVRIVEPKGFDNLIRVLSGVWVKDFARVNGSKILVVVKDVSAVMAAHGMQPLLIREQGFVKPLNIALASLESTFHLA